MSKINSTGLLELWIEADLFRFGLYPCRLTYALSPQSDADDSAAISTLENNADKLASARAGKSELGLTEQHFDSLHQLDLTRPPGLVKERL